MLPAPHDRHSAGARERKESGKASPKLRVAACVHHADTINSVMHAYPHPAGAMTIEKTKEPLNG